MLYTVHHSSNTKLHNKVGCFLIREKKYLSSTPCLKGHSPSRKVNHFFLGLFTQHFLKILLKPFLIFWVILSRQLLGRGNKDYHNRNIGALYRNERYFIASISRYKAQRSYVLIILFIKKIFYMTKTEISQYQQEHHHWPVRSDWKNQLSERRTSSGVYQLFCITPVVGVLQFHCPQLFFFYHIYCWI